MKSLFRLPNLLLLAVAIFAFTACTEEPEFKIPPSVDFSSAAGFLDADATLTAGSPINVQIIATKGDNPMTALEVQQDGARISDIGRITINGAAASSAAPVLFDAEKDAFTWDISITPHESGASDYTFLVSDEGGESSSATITITIEVPMDPPTLAAPNGVFALSANAGGVTSINLMAAPAAGSTLSTISVWEGGVEATGTDRFFFGGIEPANGFEGSLTLEEADQAGFTKDLFIRASSTVGTIDSYTLQVTDANGNTATLDITVEATAAGTPLSQNLTGALLNASGPQGQGGLDLDTGNGAINSTSLDAELKDEGIDSGLPNATNWKQQISGANGSIIGLVDQSTFPEVANFDDILYKEQVQTISTGTTPIAVSSKVQIGDVFAVANPTSGRFYLIKVTNVSLTTDDNADSYTFSIKW